MELARQVYSPVLQFDPTYDYGLGGDGRNYQISPTEARKAAWSPNAARGAAGLMSTLENWPARGRPNNLPVSSFGHGTEASIFMSHHDMCRRLAREPAMMNSSEGVSSAHGRRTMCRILDWLRIHRSTLSLLVFSFVVTLASCIHYLATMLEWTQPGFSLDDSWIHLQFARTIFEGHPWEYSPGVPSTGSTSPLWAIVLSFLFLFTQDPTSLVWGTYFMSAILYCGCSGLVALIVRSYTQERTVAGLAVLGFVLFPRNTWLMLSGMETPVFLFTVLLSVWLLDKPEAKYDPLIGVVGGLAYLARPEGLFILITCVPARFLIIGLRGQLSLGRVISFLSIGIMALLVAAPWIAYCLSVTGLPFPDTFYSKVHVPTQYEIDFWSFWWNAWLLEFPFITLGAVTGAYLVAKGKPYTWLLAISLFLFYRLNAPYIALINNARYLVPVFDLLVITSVPGSVLVLRRILSVRKRADWKAGVRILTNVVVIAWVVLPLVPGYIAQAPFFGNAVKNINEQQVHIGLWLKDNTPENAVLAIHDAGALRFFSNRSVIDLGRLITPAITHGNMTDVETLIYLRNNGCNYFVFFDEIFFYGFYLSGAYERIYTVHLEDNVISGRDTMSVFFVNWTRAHF